MYHAEIVIMEYKPPRGRVKMELGVFLPCFVVLFGQFEANACYEAKCDLVGFPRHFSRFGVLEAKFAICPCRPLK